MPVIGVLEPIADSALAHLRRHTTVLPPPAAGWQEQADAIIVRAAPVDGDAIRAAKCLKVIGKHGVGTDAIDLAAAAERGIRVLNTPAANADAVAELTIGLALSVLRSIAWHDRGVRTGLESPAPRVGRELKGARLGLIGLGTIGQRVAHLACHGFGAVIRAYDPFVTSPPPSLPIAMAGDLAALCREADILSVHVPLTPATRGLVDAELLSTLPEGAVVINTGRGGVVDEAALLAALRKGRIAGAGLDVFEDEPPAPGLALLEHPNVVATPHIGASTAEALERMGHSVAEQVLDALGIPQR